MKPLLKYSLLFVFIFLILGCNTGQIKPDKKSLDIAKDGKSDYVIVIANNASQSEKYAADELHNFLKEISGADIPVVTDNQAIQKYEIILGSNNHLNKLNAKIDFARLGNEGFTIQTSGKHLIIAGGRLRGSMYGVYEFLESYLGCRWFSSKVSKIPKQPTIKIPAINNTQIPVFEYREDFYTDTFDADWSARNKMNSSTARLDAQRGCKITYHPSLGHTFYTLVPPEKYFSEHPEYFSEKNGKRFYEGGQLCLTNPDTVKICIQKVKEWIKEKPEANILVVSQNDWAGWCECADCKALDEQEGSHSGTIINFVNQIAQAIEKDYPDKAIDTFAYQYGRKPPRTIKPRPNVIVRLCSIECCFAHPLATCPENASFLADLKDWSGICNRLYVWDYVTNFAHYVMPFPNFAVLKPNIQLFAKNHVKGVFEEGNYSPGGCGEFAELRAYVLAKLLWNPDYDSDKAVAEFMDAYYGASAPPIRKYFDLIHSKVRDENIHLGIYDPPIASYLTADVIAKAAEYFNEAKKLADSPEVLQRVLLAEMPILYVQIVTAPGDKPAAELLAKFLKIGREAKITNLGEFGDRSLDRFESVVNHRRPFLGIRSANNPAPDINGILIEEVITGKPAEQAGIKAGDIIISANGQTVNNLPELIKIISEYKVGQSVKVKIQRAKETIELTLTLAAAPLY
ncbi:MAG: DUF4838 domain-containing protein [Planctomycetota bacterium]